MKQKYQKFALPRGNCRWCGYQITARDYWLWWLRRYHRRCLTEIRKREEG
jgi:hypothetical protein